MAQALDLENGLRIANRMRYWDGIHFGDREDFVQDVLVEIMERAECNGGGLSTKEMWQAARCVRNRYWRAYKKKTLSLNMPIADTEGPIELWETLPSNTPDLDDVLDATLRLEDCPPGVKKIARKLDRGDPLTLGEEAYLRRFREDGRPNPNLTWQRKRYWQRKSSGLCVTCGERVEGGFARCAACRERFCTMESRWKRGKGRAWQAELKEHLRREGRCWRCGRLPEPGRKKCSHCLAKDREYLRRWRERQKARDELRKALQGYSREIVIAALERAIKDLKEGAGAKGGESPCWSSAASTPPGPNPGA